MEFKEPISNNLKKFISSLKSKQIRESNKLFIAEGWKLCSELLASGIIPEMVVVRSSNEKESDDLANLFYKKNVPVYLARKQQFDQLCDTKTPQGILAVVKMGENYFLTNYPILFLDGVNDPGNLGTIIRTADWFGFNNIVCGGESADKYNAKTVRSSMGSLFRMNVSYVPKLEDYIQSNCRDYKIFGASLTGKLKLTDLKHNSKYGIVFGSEAHGISENVRKILTSEFIIPGFGQAESLNVAVSVGITLYHLSTFNAIKV